MNPPAWPRAALVRTDPERASLLGPLRSRLEVVGYSVSELDADDASALADEQLLVIPTAADLPTSAVGTIDGHMRRGGRIIALGAPLWGNATDQTALPRTDLIAPSYKFFDMHDVAHLEVRTDQCIVRGDRLPVPTILRSHHPRATGGFNKGRTWRWIPLIEGHTEDGQWRGAPASLIAHFDGPYKDGVFAAFGVEDGDWYESPAVLDMIQDLAGWMKNPTLLLDGGTDHYTYFEDQTLTLGIRASTLGAPDDLSARVTIRDAATGEQIANREWSLTFSRGQIGVASEGWQPDAWPEDGFTATAELVHEDVVIDRLVHDVHIWRPQTEKRSVSVRDGIFVCDGEEWRAHGVNYMPSSGVATEDFLYFHRYLSAASYDPEVIERDLGHIADMGLNAISIFVFEQDRDSLNLLDLLRRARNHGLKANLSLRPSNIGEQMGVIAAVERIMPMFAQIIEQYRLSENDTVFAYDLVWEPQFGGQGLRRMWDEAWERWVIERYGTLANAERDWDHAIPRDAEGGVTNPDPSQMEAHGPSFRMVAAYRRFLDTVLYKQWGEARRILSSADPNHLVSFRMWHAGDPTYRSTSALPYDFPYLAAAVDFLGPEAYGRIGDWEKVKPGRFTFEWARLADPSKPMVWAEIGVHVAGVQPTPDEARFQNEYYADFQRMMISSGVRGVFYWFYPGGYRPDDDGRDYGIIEPDGSDRPVTITIREWASTFLAAPPAKPIDHWIEVDRDARSEGLVGMYQEVEAEFWTAIEKDLTPGLRTLGTGTDSATCPLLAVGNTPCDGTNPPKYLDAAFDIVELLDASGSWLRVANGGNVEMRAGAPIRVRVTISNLGEATLLPGSGDGSVHLAIDIDGEVRATSPLPKPVPHLGSIAFDDVELTTAPSGPIEVNLRLLVRGRTPFGERYRLVIRA